jgi:multiple sugar transport system substrate-binding protein
MVRKVMVVAAALALAGCGEDGTEPAGKAPAPITFQVTGDPEETQVYGELVRAYKAATGGTVNIVNVPERDAHLAKLTTSFSAGRQPDVFLINYRNVGPFAARDVIEPVPRDFPRGDYFDIPIKAFEFGGKLQCVPQNASSLAVYVNLDAFAKAGVKVPKESWTYDEFIAAAEKLTDGKGNYGVGFDPNLIRTAPWVWAAGGELVDDDDAPTTFRFDTPEGRRGLQHMLDIRRKGLAPTFDEADSKGNDERFLEGSVAMYLSSRRDVPLLRTIKGFEWDVAPFPKDVEEASVLHSDGFCVSRGGKVAAARAFTEWSLGREGQEILAASGRTVPSLKAVAESDAFLGQDPANSRVFLDALEHMHRLPTTEGWTEVEANANDVIESLYYGKLELDAALKRLAEETDGAF